ncbi:MAG: threonine synthase [Myxococcota bacterium]
MTRNPPALVCSGCGKRPPWQWMQVCDDCGGLMDVEYDLRDVTLHPEGSPVRRFFDLLPLLSRESIIEGDEGNTPCFHAKELGASLGFSNLWLKVEGENPTCTTKDRQGPVGVGALLEMGVTHFSTASTGNSATAMARIVSRYPELHMHLFVGSEFLDRLEYADADNVTVYWLRDGTFVDAGKAAAWFARREGIALDRGFASFAKREALKTVYLESVFQVERPIEAYFQSVSSGMGVYATHGAATQLKALGTIEKLPRLVAVQEETCDPMVRSFQQGLDALDPAHVVATPHGLSKATLRGDPTAAYPHLLRALRGSDGSMQSAAQAEMRAMRERLFETQGVDACYTSVMTAVAAEGMRRRGELADDAVVLLNLTGADRHVERAIAPDYLVERDGEEWSMTAMSGAPEDLLEQVVQVVRQSQRLGADEPLDASTRLVDAGLNLDSVAVLELLLALEKHFACRIEEREVTNENFQAVGSVTELVRRKLAAGE